MTEKEYKEKLEAFKSSCRVYKREKEILEESDQNKKGFGDEQLYSYMKEDIQSVDSMFAQIGDTYGINARLIIWLLFVEQNTQQEIADRFGLTRRQLQYSVNKWLHRVFDSEAEPV